MGSNDWNLMAGLALEQILERNDNGNLYPLTTLETQILSDIKEMIMPPEEPPQEKPADPQEVKTGGKKQQPPATAKAPAKKEPEKRTFVGLGNEDNTG